jgi:hypothetical protein
MKVDGLQAYKQPNSDAYYRNYDKIFGNKKNKKGNTDSSRRSKKK